MNAGFQVSLRMLDDLIILDPVSDKTEPFIEVGQVELSFHVGMCSSSQQPLSTQLKVFMSLPA